MAPSAPEFGKALIDDFWRERRDGAAQIAHDGRGTATIMIPQLSQALEDTNWRVRSAAATALGLLSTSDGWQKQWKRPNIKARRAIPELAIRLGDADLGVRKSAAEALQIMRTTGSFGSLVECAAPAVPELTRRLREDTWHQRAFAAQVLGTLGPPALTSVLEVTRGLVDDSYAVRDACKTALDDLVQISHIADHHALCAAAAGELASKLRIQQTYTPWAEESPCWQVRVSAAWALGRGGGLVVVRLPQLCRELTSDDPIVRLLAARAIGNLGSSAAPAIPDLIESQFDGDRSVRAAVKAALKGHWREEFQDFPEERVHERGGHLSPGGRGTRQVNSRPNSAGSSVPNPERLAHLNFLRKQPEPGPSLAKKIAKIEHADADVRGSAVKALVHLSLQAMQGLPELIRTVSDPRSHIAIGAKTIVMELYKKGAFGQLCESVDQVDVVREMLPMLEDEKWIVRFTAAEALAHLAVVASRAFTQMHNLADDTSQDAEHRRSAQNLLSRLRAKGALVDYQELALRVEPELRIMGQSNDKKWRGTAQDVLSRLAANGLLRPMVHARPVKLAVVKAVPEIVPRLEFRPPTPPPEKTVEEKLKAVGRGSGGKLKYPIMADPSDLSKEEPDAKSRRVLLDRFALCSGHDDCGKNVKANTKMDENFTRMLLTRRRTKN